MMAGLLDGGKWGAAAGDIRCLAALADEEVGNGTVSVSVPGRRWFDWS